jgi:hypothetical protein
MLPVSTCRSCGQRIRFVQTPSGKTMPVNAEAEPDGTLEIREEDGVEVVHHAGRAAQDTLWPELRYKSHFSNCPSASLYRKSRV